MDYHLPAAAKAIPAAKIPTARGYRTTRNLITMVLVYLIASGWTSGSPTRSSEEPSGTEPGKRE